MRTPQFRRTRARLAARSLVLGCLSILLGFVVSPVGICQASELGWSYPPAGPVRVHVIRGSSYYTREYRLEEVLARAGAGGLTENTPEDRESLRFGRGSSGEAGWLSGHPDPAGPAMNHHLVVVCAVSASGLGKNQKVLADYVAHGGSVLFFCDSSTFGERSDKSALAAMVPLEFPDAGPWTLETTSASDGVVLKAGPDCTAEQKRLLDAASENPPRVYSYYPIKPTPTAKVLLVTGDDKPILVTHEFGKGRVAVFTATCRGYPKEGQLAYWKWNAWPALLAATVQQLATAAGDVPRGLDENGRSCVSQARRRAYDLLDGLSEAGRTEFEAVLSSAAARCHDAGTAEFLLGMLAEYPPDLPGELAGELGQTIAPWVDASCARHARTLVESGQVGKTILGLIVLGAAAQDAASTLTAFYETGAAHGQGGSGISLARGDSQGVEAIMVAQENARGIRRAAVIGLGMLGKPAALPLLKKAVRTHSDQGRYSTDSDKVPDAIEPEHQDYQNALLSALLCGDAESAGPVVDFLLVNAAIAAQTPTEEKPSQRPAAVAWQQQLHRRLATAPDSVLPALAVRIAAEQNSNIATTAIAALGGRRLPAETAQRLSESPVAAVAEIGKRNQEP